MVESDGEHLPAEINRRKPMSKRRLYAKERMQNLCSVLFIHKDYIYIHMFTASNQQSKKDILQNRWVQLKSVCFWF